MSREPTAKELHIRRRSYGWPPTPGHSGKVACPRCGQTGYPGGTWTYAHLDHEVCSLCGKTTTVKGASGHKRLHQFPMTVHGASILLGMSPGMVYYWLGKAGIPVVQENPVLLDEAAFEQLRAYGRKKVD